MVAEQPETGEGVTQTYVVDDRGLFCRHCGRARWLHPYKDGVGFLCCPCAVCSEGAASHPTPAGAAMRAFADGTCRCGAAPIGQDGLCATCHDEITPAGAAMPDDAVERGKWPRLTEAMIMAACKAHYGSDNIDGISMTVDGRNYSFRQAFRRMWKGVCASLATDTPEVKS